MMDALRRINLRESSTYLRLTTKRVDQQWFPQLDEARQREELRRQVLAGAYRLRDCRGCANYTPGINVVHLFACGALVPEAIEAHQVLQQEGVFVNVFNVTGPGPLFASFRQAATAQAAECTPQPSLLAELVPAHERVAPVVTLPDAHPHSLAWIGSALGTRVWPLGVTGFGESGSLNDIYREYRLDVASITATCRAAASAIPTPV